MCTAIKLFRAYFRAQNLRQGIFMETSFRARVSRIGLGILMDINIFVIHFFPNLSHKSKSTQMLRPKKEKSVVSFNNVQCVKVYRAENFRMGYP